MNIKINGVSLNVGNPQINSVENYNDLVLVDIDNDIDFCKSSESMSVMLSSEGFVDKLKEFGNNAISFIKKMIEKLMKLKDWFVNLFKKIKTIIGKLINRIFNKKIEIKDTALNGHEVIVSFNCGGIVNRTLEAKINLDEIKEYGLYSNDMFPNYISCDEYNKILITFSNVISEIKNIAINNSESKLSEVISILKKYKSILYTKNTPESAFNSIKQFAMNLKNIKDEDKLIGNSDELADFIDWLLGKLNTALKDYNSINLQKVSEEEKNKISEKINNYSKTAKVLNLILTLIANYNSARLRINLELVKIIERETGKFGVGVHNNADMIKLIRQSFDTYVIKLENVDIAENNFANENEYQRFIKIAKDIQNTLDNNQNSVSRQFDSRFNDNVRYVLNVIASKNAKMKMILGTAKLSPTTAFTLYGFSFDFYDDVTELQGNIVLDNRKIIDMNSFDVLYHTSSVKGLSNLSPSSISINGMLAIGQGIATIGKNTRVYAGKVPLNKTGMPISGEGLVDLCFQYLNLGFPKIAYDNFIQKNDVNGFVKWILDKTGVEMVYRISKSDILGVDGEVYADPEHSGVMQKITSKNIRDAAVYIEFDSHKALRVTEIDIMQFINTDKIISLFQNKYSILTKMQNYGLNKDVASKLYTRSY